jgi:hypothetical protein
MAGMGQKSHSRRDDEWPKRVGQESSSTPGTKRLIRTTSAAQGARPSFSGFSQVTDRIILPNLERVERV